ncbi:MAG: hypothetical protein A2X36_11880 [Elusimicrobia bacterium GWA2_69_24]|nr:MAG: hypothetical protein A2X36_11880 [Elusimicrobia bacterium GWA2_69_24]HBL16325.1 hypothetical protein [Elusimicrobiota bacterium]
MSPLSRVLVGIFFFLLGLGYLYKPGFIERMNAFLRDYLLNDAHIALERRKWGVFFLLLSVFFLYTGYMALYPPP